MNPHAGPQPARFMQLLPRVRQPSRAGATVMGTIPLRAAQHCEPFTAASAFGWHVYPAFDFDLIWSGHDISWRRSELEPWQELSVVMSGHVFPELTQGASGPTDAAAVPVLARAPEAAIVQLWPGLVVSTPARWSVLVRPLVNHPKAREYDVLEGLIETDWWHGPLITPLRLAKTDRPIRFGTHLPYCQIQLVHQAAYADATFEASTVVDATAGLPDGTRQQFLESIHLRNTEGVAPGSYKRSVKQRHRMDASSTVAG